ncbi:hypothetical protein HDU76_009642 [Blyttiomyces sp. JEL0837]|nr:hypothetical protein HDU76_009642 [Blyttiomyces sp. JEL0837]
MMTSASTPAVPRFVVDEDERYSNPIEGAGGEQEQMAMEHHQQQQQQQLPSSSHSQQQSYHQPSKSQGQHSQMKDQPPTPSASTASSPSSADQESKSKKPQSHSASKPLPQQRPMSFSLPSRTFSPIQPLASTPSTSLSTSEEPHPPTTWDKRQRRNTSSGESLARLNVPLPSSAASTTQRSSTTRRTPPTTPPPNRLNRMPGSPSPSPSSNDADHHEEDGDEQLSEYFSMAGKSFESSPNSSVNWESPPRPSGSTPKSSTFRNRSYSNGSGSGRRLTTDSIDSHSDASYRSVRSVRSRMSLEGVFGTEESGVSRSGRSSLDSGRKTPTPGSPSRPTNGGITPTLLSPSSRSSSSSSSSATAPSSEKRRSLNLTPTRRSDKRLSMSSISSASSVASAPLPPSPRRASSNPLKMSPSRSWSISGSGGGLIGSNGGLIGSDTGNKMIKIPIKPIPTVKTTTSRNSNGVYSNSSSTAASTISPHQRPSATFDAYKTVSKARGQLLGREVADQFAASGDFSGGTASRGDIQRLSPTSVTSHILSSESRPVRRTRSLSSTGSIGSIGSSSRMSTTSSSGSSSVRGNSPRPRPSSYHQACVPESLISSVVSGVTVWTGRGENERKGRASDNTRARLPSVETETGAKEMEAWGVPRSVMDMKAGEGTHVLHDDVIQEVPEEELEEEEWEAAVNEDKTETKLVVSVTNNNADKQGSNEHEPEPAALTSSYRSSIVSIATSEKMRLLNWNPPTLEDSGSILEADKMWCDVVSRISSGDGDVDTAEAVNAQDQDQEDGKRRSSTVSSSSRIRWSLGSFASDNLGLDLELELDDARLDDGSLVGGCFGGGDADANDIFSQYITAVVEDCSENEGKAGRKLKGKMSVKGDVAVAAEPSSSELIVAVAGRDGADGSKTGSKLSTSTSSSLALVAVSVAKGTGNVIDTVWGTTVNLTARSLLFASFGLAKYPAKWTRIVVEKAIGSQRI